MEKATFFPGARIIIHNLALAVIPTVFAVVLVIEQGPLGLLVLALTLFLLRDLGLVVVRPGRLVSYRLYRRQQAQTPAVLACEVDMMRRQVLKGVSLTYWFPALVTDTGKTIRLPIATKSRDKAVRTAAMLRQALGVPVNGQDLIPQGRLARTLSGSKTRKSEPEFGSDEWLKAQWS